MVHDNGVVFVSCKSNAEHKLGGAYDVTLYNATQCNLKQRDTMLRHRYGQDYTFVLCFADGSTERINRVREIVHSRYSVRFFENSTS